MDVINLRGWYKINVVVLPRIKMLLEGFTTFSKLLPRACASPSSLANGSLLFDLWEYCVHSSRNCVGASDFPLLDVVVRF